MVTTTSQIAAVPARALRRCSLPALMLALLMPRAGAADWSVVPSLRLRESYSDNILLAPRGREQSDLITEIAPSIRIAGDSPRLHVDLSYTLQKLFYRHQSDISNNQLAAGAHAEVLPDWLFVDARAAIAQRYVSAFGPQPVDDLPRGANSTGVRSIGLSPYLRHRFRGIATAELRYSRDTVDSDNDFLGVRSDSLMALLTSDDSGARGLNWSLRYDQRRTDDPPLTPVELKKTTLSLGYPVTSHLNLFGSGGYEDQGYASSGASGRFWSLGAGWYPSPRSSLVASAGKRFFGNTYALDALHRSRHTSWSLGYHEDITSTPAQLSQLTTNQSAAMLDQLWSTMLPDPVQRQQQIIAFLRLAQGLGPDAGAVNYFSHRYFLQKQWQLSMVRASGRSTFAFSVNTTRRVAQTSSGVDHILLPDVELAQEERTRQAAANAGWSWRLSPRNNLQASAAYSTIESDSSGRQDQNLVLSAGVQRVLRPRVTAALDLRQVRHSSNRGGNYREHGISATLNLVF